MSAQEQFVTLKAEAQGNVKRIDPLGVQLQANVMRLFVQPGLDQLAAAGEPDTRCGTCAACAVALGFGHEGRGSVSQQPLPFDVPAPVWYARMHAEQFTEEFMAYLPENVHVFEAFEREALAIARRRTHYSARTIVEVLRHNSALQEAGGAYKLNDHFTPGLARLFALIHPAHAGLFEFREAKAVKRERQAA